MSTPDEKPDRGRSAEKAPARRASTRLLPTLLDRLRDDAPSRRTESPDEYAVTREQMRRIVQRDLAFLFNTTNLEDQIDRARYPAVAASTINFGLPPLHTHAVASHGWEVLERAVRRAIRDFEPRLLPDTLTVTRAPERAEYGLSFEVRGMLWMEPYPLQFIVQSTVDLEANRLEVSRLSVN
ncbi:type VI secretion system baseplate subunit TssE [Burkholderia pyrrocinia]|uniref:type VI secretion system baseplate subunit TssE n=1 Tax=Burkholderia pyrrocinia TaxID=60550 RepID=UPI001589EE0C|nr:type VI secretion system baseplate subunit TssE [Burkholderia pyrrocinia]